MDIAGILSLKQLTLTKVICAILDKKPIWEKLFLPSRSLCYLNSNFENKRRLACVGNSILEKISCLVLPEVLKEELACLVRPCLIEIGALLHFNCALCNVQEIPTNVIWTPQGTIDKKKTMELLVQDENVDVYTRFKIACLYCLEDQIYSLWPQLPKRYKDSPNEIPEIRSFCIFFWLPFIEAKRDQLVFVRKSRCYKLGLKSAVDYGNVVAFRNFSEKFTSEQRRNMLPKLSKQLILRYRYCHVYTKPNYIDLLCILLSVMNEEQQVELFTNHADEILKFFWDWPKLNLSKILPAFWTYLQPSFYQYMFRKLRRRIFKGRKDRDYQVMFRMFWDRIPDGQKEEVINHCTSSLVELFKVLEERNVRLILDDVVSTMGIKIDFQSNRWKICRSLICHNNWGLFKYYLETFSKVMLMSFKAELESNISMEVTEQHQGNMMSDKSFEIIDKLIQECDKRKNMVDDHSAKKLCI